MQITQQSKPWHKYPLVWMMIAIPFSAVIMGVVMIWLAVDTDDGLVADDYYKQGLEINDVISLDRRATELELKAVISFNVTDRVINLKFDKGLLEGYPQTLQLNFQHATHANSDVFVELSHGINDSYIGYLQQTLSEGVWYFEVSDDDWKLSARSHVRADNVIPMESSY